jgi:dTDP-4-dehydrorhamnose reductase
MAKVLILGGSGLLGRALQRRRRSGHELSATHCRNPMEHSRAFDLRASMALPAGRFDVVICSLPLAKILMETKTDLAQAARPLCASFGMAKPILLSTDAVFSGREGHYSESAKPDPVTDYGRAQAGLDGIFLGACPAGLIVRTSFLFGGRAPHFDKRLGPLLNRSIRSVDQRWPSNIFRSPTEVDFCADAIWRCVESDQHGIMNICGERMSIRDFFAKALLARGPFELPPPYYESRDDVAVDTSLDPRAMESKLGIDHRAGWDWYFQNAAGET